MTPRNAHRVVGWVLVALTVVIVMVNQRDVGIARDETVYMSAGARYFHWWTHPGAIEPVWGGVLGGGNNPEHPPFVKELEGLSHAALFGVLGEVGADRFPSALLHGACVGLVYWMTLALWGFVEAIVAALCLLLLPRALFHAGLAAFDAPIMTLWFATVVAYWRCLDGRKWPWQVGVCWGLALATKHTALLLPFALGIHYAVLAIRAKRLVHWRVLVSLGVLGPLVIYALWPLLWTAPYAHLKAWLEFHTHHVHYNFEYLGQNWNHPRFPWHVALVTTLFTVPTATLAAALAGVYALARKRPDDARRPVLLLALSAAASIGPFFLGSTPIFGAEKHWMPVLPTICIVAGVGAVWAARRIEHRFAVPAVAACIVLAGATEVVTAHPYALTWYSALAGGAPGGADLGMNRQFWGVAAKGVLPFLRTQPPGPVYSHDASPAWGWYIQDGLLPEADHDAGHETDGIHRSAYAIVIHEKHFNRHDYLIWADYKTVRPVFVLRSDGVPIVSVYKRP